MIITGLPLQDIYVDFSKCHWFFLPQRVQQQFLEISPYQRLEHSIAHFRLCLRRASCFCYCCFILYWHLSPAHLALWRNLERPQEKSQGLAFSGQVKPFFMWVGIMIGGISRSNLEKVKLVILPCLECWGFTDRIRGQLRMGGDLTLQLDPVVASSEGAFGCLYLISSVLSFSY